MREDNEEKLKRGEQQPLRVGHMDTFLSGVLGLCRQGVICVYCFFSAPLLNQDTETKLKKFATEFELCQWTGDCCHHQPLSFWLRSFQALRHAPNVE